MELLIVRHGPAEDRARWRKTGRPDAERPLTKDGRRKTKAAARGMAELMRGVDVVAFSPWARAAQSAEFVSAAFAAKAVECPELIPDRPVAGLLAWLGGRTEKRVALIGHEPHLSRFASWLLTGREASVLSLKKSQALLLSLETASPGRATLLWSVPPRILRDLSRR